MGPLRSQQRLIAEVSHQINSPLAAIRNALYLAAQHSNDPEVLRYLVVADQEVTSIVIRIKELRETIELGRSPLIPPDAPQSLQSMRKAA